MNQIQNQPLQPGSTSARLSENEITPHPIPEQLSDLLATATLPSSSRPILSRETLGHSITLGSRHQSLLDLAHDIDNQLKVAVRFPRFGISDFFTGIMAYTIGISDVELFNFRLLRSPRILPGLLEGVTFGNKAILYDRERIPELKNIQRFDMENLKNCNSDWLAIISDNYFWEANPSAFSIEIVHVEQLRSIAKTTELPSQHEGFIGIWVNRGSRMLDDSRRTKLNSAPDIHCGCRSINSDSEQTQWRYQLSAGELYAIPIDASLILPVIETLNQQAERRIS